MERDFLLDRTDYYVERQIQGAGCRKTKGAPQSPIGRKQRVPHTIFVDSLVLDKALDRAHK
jgi:hypothetical protein